MLLIVPGVQLPEKQFHPKLAVLEQFSMQSIWFTYVPGDVLDPVTQLPETQSQP